MAFDPKTARIDSGEQARARSRFDPESALPADGDQETKGISGHARDLGLSALKGAIAVPEAIVGLADIPTGGRVGRFLENEGGSFGFRPKEAKEILSDLHTDQFKAQQHQFQEADGVLDKTAVALENPSLIANTVVESVAPMLAGGVAARGVMGATKLGQMGAKGAAAAGAIGEGTMMAGSQAEAIRQEADDGLLTPTQAGAAVATGALGTLFGYLGGRVAQRFGLGDADTMIAQGAKPQAVAGEIAKLPAKSIPRQVVEGAISEGFLEELPQSISEQIIQNLALDKPWSEGVEDAAVMGTLAGMAMGGGASFYSGMTHPTQPGESVAPPADDAPQPEPEGFGLATERPVIDDAALARAGVFPPVPAPIINDRALAPVATPSQQMGLDPASGPMSAAAALAVDTGASPTMQQAAPSVDPETGEILQAGAKVAEQNQATDTPEQMRERLAFIEQQARTNGGWDRRLVEERDRLQAELAKVEPVADQNTIKSDPLAAAGAEPALQASDQDQTAADETPSAEQFDVSGRTSEQLQYLSGSGQPGWKEAATAEIQRRDAQQPAATPALSAEAAQPVLVEQPTPAVAQQAEASAPTAAPVADDLRRQLQEVESKILAAAADAMGAGGGDIETAMKSRKVPVTLKAQRKRIKEQLQQANVAFAQGVQSVDAPERVEVAARAQEASGQEGEKKFAPETGTLGIPRAEMPQVPSKSHGGLVKHLNAQGIAHETTSVDAASLKPTQAEYSPEKVEAAKTAAGDRAVIVSSDGHIVDGHHQALAAAEQGKQVKAIVLDAPVDQALEAVKNSPSAQAATPASSPRSESAQPGAEQPEALEFTTLKDRNGNTVTVRTADLSSARERMPTFTKEGKRKATHIHRDNLDPTGEKQAEGAKETAANPLFNVITAKDGKAFAIKAAASRELNARGLAETHEVVPAGDVQAGMKGYVVRKKADVSRTADAAQGPSEALPDFSVFYNDENGVRWGIPYAMRQGQQPKDIKPEFRGDWVRLSGAKWSGNRDLMPAEQQAMSERLQPGEWVDVAQPAAAVTEGDTQTVEVENGATGDQGSSQPEAFVSAPDGSIDFGEITPEMALAMRRQAGKIRLQRGDDSFGERHIEIRHGDDIRRLGFNDVASFVADIARNINQVWQPGKTAQLVAIHELANDRVMFVELRGAQDEDGDYYTVRSAFPARKGFIKNKGWNLLWEDGRAQPSTNASSSAPFAEPAQDIAGGPATIPSGQSSDETVAQRPAAGDVPDVRRSPAGQNARTADVEFPLQEAQASYSGISHSGTSRGKADADEFHAYIDAARDAGLAVATTAAQKAAVEQATADLRAEYLRQYRRLMSVRSGTYSGYVAGRSGLNSKQADKRNSAYDRAIDTFVAWQKASQDSPRKAAMAARTPEQIQADQQAAESARQEKEDRKESRDRKLMERILSWKKGGEPVAITKIANLAGVNYGKDRYPTSIKLAPTDGSTLTDDKFDLAALFREKGMSVPDSKRRVRELVDAVRAESAADGEASLSAQHEALMASVRTGKATPEAFKASFEQVVSNEAAIKAELSAKTKAELLRDGGPYLQMRYANEKKDGVVDAVYRQMIGEYALGETVSYGIARDSYQKAVRRMVEATDADKLAQYVRDREAAIREAEVRRTARAEAMANPQTLNDYRSLMSEHIREGKTRHEAFLMLTPEQRIRYDELEAEGTREAREARKRAAQNEVRAAGQTTGGQIIATKHTRDGHDLFVVQLADRLSREDYNTVLAGAKRLGGRYSAFRGNGAVPGFQFRTREDAEAFLKLAGGDVSAAKDQVEQRRDAFADDKSQTAAERLVEMADRMEQEANAEESRDRKANTARRARFASAALNAAAAQKAMARTMRNIAQAIQDGKAKFLDAVRTRTQVEALLGYVRTAKDNELRAKYPSYAEQEKRRGEPATAETAGFAEFPSYTAFRSDLAMLGRQMLEIDGTKKLGQKLMSVADDVTDAYLEFARDNIRAVSQFGRGDALAEFASRDDAERAIRKSGLVGKAIVLPIKRGQNRVILSPSEAMSRKVWAGDGDKRITLSGEFGKELVEAIGRRGNKTNGLAVPWQFQNAYDRRKLLSRIGIETPSEFRSALREVIGLQETAVANKVREMELAMVGRRADGLDFFPTPAEIADQMVEAAEITPDMAVLEPSAGMGHIADRIRAAGAEPDVIEISGERRELLEEKGYHLAEVNDFLNMEPRKFFTYGDIFRAPDGKQGILRGLGSMGSQRVRLEDEQGNRLGLYQRDEVVGVSHRGSWSGYDRIIMNPPFSDRRDAEHVQHAFTLLRPGGRIVAIMGEGVFFGQDKRAQDFRDWLDSVGGTSEKLPEGSFMDPSLPVQTGVNARMVVIDRPAVDGGDRQPGDADPEVAFSATFPRDRNALLTGITEKGLVRAMRLQFGGLSEVTQKMLERGRAGKRGGAVVINTADMREVGRIVAEKTGRDLDSTMRKFSTAGVVNGFYDPKSGLTFLVGPNLNPVTATAVLLHEVMHGQQRQKIDQRAMEMVRGRQSLKDPAMRGFLDRVARRMAMAGESNKASEASAYIVEQAVIEGRSAGYQFADNAFVQWADKTLGKRIGDFLRSFLGMVRTWALRNGLGAKTMTVDDFVGYAMAGLDKAATGEVRGRSVTVSASMAQDEQSQDVQFSRASMKGAQALAKNIGDGLKSITVHDVKRAGKHKLTDWLKLGLQFLGRRQLVDVYGDVLPLAEYDRLAAQMEADKNDVGASADDLARRWGKLPDEGRLADLMHDATLAQIDADDAVEHMAGDDLLKSHMLKAQFAQLSPEAQKVYREARDHYRKHHAEVRQAITDRIMRSELREERRAELLKRMDDDFFKSIKGVYFPLARFGQYVVVTKDETGKVASVSRAETMAEAEAMRQEMVKAFPAKDGYQVGRVILSKEFIAGRDMVGRGFMSELFNALDEQQLDPRVMAELEDTLGQLYLSSLPDLSWAKHGIHRKGTPGFSQDARRAFAQNTFHGARHLAKLRYGDQMQAELERMQKHVDEMSALEDFDQPAAQRVVDEMNKRHEAMMNPKSNPLSTALTSFGFVYYLGISPAAAVVNLSQTPLVAYPVLGAKWGFRKAGTALMTASKETMEGKNDLRSRLKNEDEIAAYDEAVRTGVIDVTMAHDLAGIAQGEDAKVMWKIRPVMRAASFLFHHAERFNRQATFLAAYRLARDAGAKHDTAYAQAVKATYDGHFDYSAGNRPRVMQGNVAKVVLLFKQYAQNMIYTIARNAYQSVKGESPEVRREARKVFASLMTMHAAAAGVLGLPMVGTLLALASALGGSDDEPWDAEVALRNMLADAFGPKASEVIARGFSRLTPWDVSGRVGLDKLLLPDVNESLEGQRWAEAFATAMLGPVIGMGVNAAKGAQKMSDGDYARGLEDMLPIFARNPIKAYRQYSEGEVDRTGVVIKDEVSLAGVLGQASGFSPSEIRLAFEGRSAVMSADRRLNERRQDLVTQFARAAMEQDQGGMVEARSAIAEFNKVNPGRRITPPQLWQSVRNRERRIIEAEEGVYLPRTRRDVLDVGRFAEAL